MEPAIRSLLMVISIFLFSAIGFRIAMYYSPKSKSTPQRVPPAEVESGMAEAARLTAKRKSAFEKLGEARKQAARDQTGEDK